MPRIRSAKDRHVTFRASADYVEDLKVAAARRRQSVQTMIEEALQAELGRDVPVRSDSSSSPGAGIIKEVSKAEEPWVDRLLYVLRHGDQVALKAVKSNLELFEIHTNRVRADQAEAPTSKART